MSRRPARVSIGCYAIEANGQTVILQRMGRRGFKVVQRPGMLSPTFQRLRDAAAAAVAATSPWPFDVPKVFDAALDMPVFLRRGAT